MAVSPFPLHTTTTSLSFRIDTPTKRPLYIYVVYNSECHFPKVTIRRDPAMPELGENTVVEVKDLPAEISKRSGHLLSIIIGLIHIRTVTWS